MSKEPSKRKAFNFYLSYFDVYNEIDNDSEKLEFIDALLKRQFLGIEPTELKGLAKFGYNSQKEIINKQIKGWETKTGVSLSNHTLAMGGTEPLNNPPPQQEQEEEKEQEKVNIIIYKGDEEKKDEDFYFKKAQANYKTYAEQLFKDDGFIESISYNHIKHRNREVNVNTIHKYLKEFLIHLNEYKHVHNTKKDFSNNFSNWLRKQKIEVVLPPKENRRYV